MTNKTILFIATAIVILNIYFENQFSPLGLLLTPIILIGVSSLVLFKTLNLKPIQKSVYIFLLISLHDIGIKLDYNGRSDSEGLVWINELLFIGLIPSFIILLIAILKDKKTETINKLIAIFIFPILLFIHLLLFGELGLGK